MHVCMCVLYEENGFAQAQYVNVYPNDSIVPKHKYDIHRRKPVSTI
jgi:hypothetical protein